MNKFLRKEAGPNAAFIRGLISGGNKIWKTLKAPAMSLKDMKAGAEAVNAAMKAAQSKAVLKAFTPAIKAGSKATGVNAMKTAYDDGLKRLGEAFQSASKAGTTDALESMDIVEPIYNALKAERALRLTPGGSKLFNKADGILAMLSEAARNRVPNYQKARRLLDSVKKVNPLQVEGLTPQQLDQASEVAKGFANPSQWDNLLK